DLHALLPVGTPGRRSGDSGAPALASGDPALEPAGDDLRRVAVLAGPLPADVPAAAPWCGCRRIRHVAAAGNAHDGDPRIDPRPPGHANRPPLGPADHRAFNFDTRVRDARRHD